MPTIAQWARWVPGDPLPVGPDDYSGAAPSVAYRSPGVSSEQLRAKVEAPGYLSPAVPAYDPTGLVPQIPPPPPPQVDVWPVAPPVMIDDGWRPPPVFQPPPEELMPPTLFASSPANISYSRPALNWNSRYTGTIPNVGMPYALNAGGAAVELGATLCAYLPAGPARDTCLAAAAVARALTDNATRPSNGSGMPMNGGGNLTPTNCPTGYSMVLGQCVANNPMAMLPGGAPMFMQPAQAGYFGALSAPATMHSQTVLKCPRGLILGKDNRCYAKGSIPRQHRKWAPEPRPLVSRSDVKALARIKSIRSRVKKAASSAGLVTTTRGRGHTHPKGKK